MTPLWIKARLIQRQYGSDTKHPIAGTFLNGPYPASSVARIHRYLGALHSPQVCSSLAAGRQSHTLPSDVFAATAWATPQSEFREITKILKIARHQGDITD